MPNGNDIHDTGVVEETSDDSETGTDKKKPDYLKIILIIVLVAIPVILLLNVLGVGRANTSSISGTVDFRGIEPEEDRSDVAKLVLLQREHGIGDFSPTSVTIAVVDDAPWQWTEALEGVSYELKVDLYIGEELIKSSNTVATTAPAGGIVFVLNVTLEDIPDYVIDESQVEISGTIDLNGYVPSGSQISVWQKKKSDNEYKLATKDVAVKDGALWVWESAAFGTEYDIKATIESGTNVLGESQTERVTAPSDGIVLRIQSNAPSPTKKATIEGTITLRGAVSEHSEIVVVQKKPGEDKYKEIDRMPAVSGAPWKWVDAVTGQNYEITAGLVVDGEISSTGNVLKTMAPAAGELIIIDTNLSLKPPKDKPKAFCGEKDDGDGWNSRVEYSRVENGVKYHLIVGTSPGQDDVVSMVTDPAQTDLKVDVYAADGKSYYAQYSYTYCETCNLEDPQNWSSYSPTLGYNCTNEGIETE